MAESILVPIFTWNLQVYLIGSTACFIKIFIEYRKKLAKSGKINWNFQIILFDLISIALAGVVTLFLGANNIYQALIFGATWDFMFLAAIKRYRGK